MPSSISQPNAVPNPRPLNPIPTPDKPLLEAVDTLLIKAATADPFAVREHFERATAVAFANVWREFRKRFYGKVEWPRAMLRLRKFRLLRIAPDAPIIAELGGSDRVECTVSAAYHLMTLQGRGEPGFLQTNGYANIFYARDVKGVLCAVRVGWDGEGWVIDAIPAEDPLAWNGKHAIFCPVEGPEAARA